MRKGGEMQARGGIRKQAAVGVVAGMLALGQAYGVPAADTKMLAESERIVSQ